LENLNKLSWLTLAATRLAELEIGLAESRAESSHLHEMVSVLGELHLSCFVHVAATGINGTVGK
jgi:hypothetical protein